MPHLPDLLPAKAVQSETLFITSDILVALRSSINCICVDACQHRYITPQKHYCCFATIPVSSSCSCFILVVPMQESIYFVCSSKYFERYLTLIIFVVANIKWTMTVICDLNNQDS